MRVRLKDVAQRAGVSVATVSRVIHSETASSNPSKTAQRVQQAIADLGYQSDKNINLEHKNADFGAASRRLGCMLTSLEDSYIDPFFSDLLAGVQIQATKMGYSLGFTYSANQSPDGLLYSDVAAAGDVDGIIIMGRFQVDLLQQIRKQFPHLIYAGLNHLDQQIDEVICDARSCTQMAVEHLIQLGHKRIAYLGTVTDGNLNVTNEHRYEAYRSTLISHNIQLEKKFEWNCVLRSPSAYEKVLHMLREGNIPDAIFCANDYCAIGALKAIYDSKLQVPQDISVIGIDDIEMATYSSPMLTTVHVPRQELGMYAVKVLIDKIENGGTIPIRINLPAQLIIRESCQAR